MMPYVQLAIGMLLLSGVITYAWWTRFRVWALKQDLFEIRDALWDQAHQGGFLDAPEYRMAREGINSVIRFTPRLCLSTWLHFEKRIEFSQAVSRTVSDLEIPAVRDAMAKVGRRMVVFVYLQTLSGLLYALVRIAAYHSKKRVKETILGEAAHIVRMAYSDELRDIEKDERFASCHGVVA